MDHVVVNLPICQSSAEVPKAPKPKEPERTLCDLDKQNPYRQHWRETHQCPAPAQTNRYSLKEPSSAQERTHLLSTSLCKKHLSLKACETLRLYSAAYSLSQKVKLENSNNVVLKDMKKFYSVDAHCALKKTTSWLDEARRHSIEICSMEKSLSSYPASRSCGFISHILNERDDFVSMQRSGGHVPYCPECMPASPHSCLEADTLKRQSYSLDSKDLPNIVDPLVPEMSIS